MEQLTISWLAKQKKIKEMLCFNKCFILYTHSSYVYDIIHKSGFQKNMSTFSFTWKLIHLLRKHHIK